MTKPHMIVGQNGSGAFPEHNGKIVFPEFFGEMLIEQPGRPARTTKLYRVTPTLHTRDGKPIIWQQRHLQPLEDFPKEELLAEEIRHFISTL